MDHILVTGGAGFIGSHIVELLDRQGYAVSVLDNLLTGKRENIAEHIPFYQLDIRDRCLEELFAAKKFTHVVQLAAQTTVTSSFENPINDCDINLVGLVNVLEAARKTGVKRIIFASSAAVYGHNTQLPLREDSSTVPTSFYGLTKLTGESYLRLFSEMYGLEYFNLRFANVYGPRQSDTGEGGVISIFHHNMQKGIPLKIFGTGEQTRDFIYCEDVAQATVLAVTSETGNYTLNISTKEETSINGLLQEFSGIMGKSIPCIYCEPRPGDILHSCLDNQCAQRVLGWQPNVTIALGLAKFLRYSVVEK